MNTGKIRTKIFCIIICAIIGVILSALLTFCLIEIFSRTPLEILTITPEKVINSICSTKEGLQIFLLLILSFMLLIVVSIFRIFKLDDYLSKTYKVTPDIRIPLPVGRGQTQQGSAWWLSKKELSKTFGINTFDPAEQTMKQLLNYSKKQMNEEKEKMDLLDKGANIHQKTPNEMKVKNPDFNSQPYKKGGLVIGKKDRHIISFTKAFPFVAKRKVEDIYFVEDDMHSLTIGATRSRKNKMSCFANNRKYNAFW